MEKWEKPDLDSRATDYKEAAGNHAHPQGCRAQGAGLASLV